MYALSRIILRYLAAVLVTKGLLDSGFGSELATDADALALIQLILGSLVAACTELWYVAAKRFGWNT